MNSSCVKIDWAGTFDKICCIHYLPYKERYGDIRRELDRVGILSSENFEWHFTVDNAWNVFLSNILLRNKLAWALTPSALCVALEHYQIIKKFYEIGCDNVLILENDIVFLKDLDIVKKYMENIPSGADIALFDYFIHCDDVEFKRYRADAVNGYFARYDKLMAASCYMLSRKAMSELIPLYEKFLYPPDIYTSIKAPHDLVRCFALEHIACQR